MKTPEMVNLKITLAEPAHRRIKVRAAEERKGVQELVRELLDEATKKPRPV